MKRKDNGYVIFPLIFTVIMGMTFILSYTSLFDCFNSVLPTKYFEYARIALGGLFTFSLIWSFIPFPKFFRIFNCFILVVIISAMIVASTILPSYIGTAKKIFTEVPQELQEEILVYVKSDSGIEEIKQLSGKKIAIQESFDLENQEYALMIIHKELDNLDSAEEVSFSDLYDAIDSLYNDEVDAILMAKTYYDIILDNEDYYDKMENFKSIYSCFLKTELDYDTEKTNNITTEPFLISVTGSDYFYRLNGLDYNYPRRTDVNIICAVNPNTKQILLVTIPRDAYVLLAGRNRGWLAYDKLTHSSNYGMNAYFRTVENFMKIKFNYYIRVNFNVFINVIDAMDGVDVDNPYEFTAGSDFGDTKGRICNYKEGLIHLDGVAALMYCRARHVKHNGKEIGDEGRTRHQALVLNAMIKKATTPSFLVDLPNTIETITKDVLTNFTYDEISAIIQMQLNDMASWNISSYSIPVREHAYKSSYANGGRTQYMVILQDEDISYAQSLINKVVNGEILD